VKSEEDDGSDGIEEREKEREKEREREREKSTRKLVNHFKYFTD
jgi:hypothetical protein